MLLIAEASFGLEVCWLQDLVSSKHPSRRVLISRLSGESAPLQHGLALHVEKGRQTLLLKASGQSSKKVGLKALAVYGSESTK